MSIVQVPVALGGTNTPYNDGTGPFGMASKNGYGHAQYLFPMLSEVIAACSRVTGFARRKHAFVAPHDYVGIAPAGSADDEPVWRITRQTIAANGTAVVGLAQDVTWTGRAGHTYT